MCSGPALHVQRASATCAAGQRYMCSGTPLHMAVLHVQQSTAAYGSATCAAEHRCIWQCYICSGEALHVQQNTAAYGSATCAVEHCCIWQCYICSGEALHVQRNTAAYGSATYAVGYHDMCSGVPLCVQWGTAAGYGSATCAVVHHCMWLRGMSTARPKVTHYFGAQHQFISHSREDAHDDIHNIFYTIKSSRSDGHLTYFAPAFAPVFARGLLAARSKI